ncbi:hypothetical protein [Nocardia bovistercoris]|uniref:Diaminopimelate epimerase n=1 Tax=Nocardia bovistercoris TaxID=2785916 RepID=A0A931I9A6_9NOCA|nr:hypothetical protein [Nocardia bovistercoris]MBH0777327.1 hypothetical protein [Nocardia bovistercoris]
MSTVEVLHRVVVAYPGGNATAVVFDHALDADRKDLNTRLIDALATLDPDLPGIEQCCFATTPRTDSTAIGRMEMFGGEFCGNATRGVIRILTDGRDTDGLVEASGVDHPLRFEVTDATVRLTMPLPARAETVPEGALVALGGITHLVVTDPAARTRTTPRELLTRLLAARTHALHELPAAGVTFYDNTTGAAHFSVWVREVDTVFDETACGSGTSAIGIAAATAARNTLTLRVIQPSGESITTEATWTHDTLDTSTIAGPVDILFDGAVRLP